MNQTQCKNDSNASKYIHTYSYQIYTFYKKIFRMDLNYYNI